MLKKRRSVVTTLVVCLAGVLIVLSCAEDTQKAKRVEVNAEEIGLRAWCPVTRDSFTVHKETPVIEYKGERYYMCCPGCDSEFMKDPEKYMHRMQGMEHHETHIDQDMLGAEVVCPVSGDRFHVSEMTPVVEHKGKKYYLCCPGCELEFKKDPEKYIELIEKEPESRNMEQDDEILYWTCSMHPEVKSDVEGNCPICAMALIPVYERPTSEENVLHVSERDMELAGIRTVPATKHHVYKVIQAVGEVAYDPMLVIAQEEYVNALEMLETLEGSDEMTLDRAQTVVERGHYKLRLMGMDESEIGELERTRAITRSLVIPEQETWVYARIYESDISWVKKGQDVSVISPAYPGEVFHGKVRSVNPVLDPHARAIEARIQLYGAHQKLKPGMYVDAKIKTMYVPPGASYHYVLAIPRESVLDTGNRKVVWVYLDDGNFQPREVTVGPLATVEHNGHMVSYYPVLDGVAENEMVVTNGNFLIDSESQLTGVAAVGYGGALGVEEKPQPPIHQH